MTGVVMVGMVMVGVVMGCVVMDGAVTKWLLIGVFCPLSGCRGATRTCGSQSEYTS